MDQHRPQRVGPPGKPPSVLVPAPGGELAGVVDGEVWRVLPSGAAENLTASFAPAVRSVRALDRTGQRHLVQTDGALGVASFSAGRISLVPLPPPSPEARLVAVSPAGDGAMYTASDERGSRLLLGRTDGVPPKLVWSGNAWVAEIERHEERRIAYRALDGSERHAWLLLPRGLPRGGKAPLVVQAYPGRVFGPGGRSPFTLSAANFAAPELFAAKGYAVLLPSMPDSEESPGPNPVDELQNGLMPALDAAIATGAVDGDRVALFGHSAGGYAVLALVGQTNRFRAAVASASYSNLISLYGTFYGSSRYGDSGDPETDQLLRMQQLERGVLRMGGPPWSARERYVHNSPIFTVDRVQTPLLLVHGDMDFIPIQQAEEFFTALLRQGKDVTFVRYHGEWHTPAGKPNVLDFWSRLELWLAERLAARTEAESASERPIGLGQS